MTWSKCERPVIRFGKPACLERRVVNFVTEILLGRRTGGGPIQRTPKRRMASNRNSMARAITNAVASITTHDDEHHIVLHQGEIKKRKISDPSTEYEHDAILGVDFKELEGFTTSASKGIDANQVALLTVNGIEVTGPNLKHRNPNPNSKKIRQSLYTPNFLLPKDDIYGCYIFNEVFRGSCKVIRLLDFSDGCNIIIAEERLISHISTLAASGVLDSKLGFAYQATAKLYRFLVFTLFVKHPLFENQPCIPIGVLLYRRSNVETHSKFLKTMKELLPFLNSPDIELIVSDEPGVTKAVERELPEIPTVHVSESTMRISSTKLDFLLVSVAKALTFDHTKMVHLIYFLQCHCYNEIVRSLMGNCEGDLLIHSKYDAITCDAPSLADRVMPQGAPETLEDALNPQELVAMLSKNPPQVVGSGSDYESCSKNELQLFEGLAHFFIAKDRVDWNKSRGFFTVKGLGGKDYQVKLSGRTCTCPRGKACEHVLAVLIGTGLLARQQ